MKKILLSSDFRNTACNQLWKVVSGPLILILIPLYLSSEIQGYWYTFISLAALAIFADMGFSTILLQFSAHEYAHLEFYNDGKNLRGKKKHLVRLATLWRFAMKWALTVALFAFPVILFLGYFFLERKETQIDWLFPWVIYVFASSIVFINSMILSFIEGCNSVGEIQKIRLFISFVTVITTVLLLISDVKLYALSLALFLGAISGSLYIIFRYKSLLLQLYQVSKKEFYPWKNEIMPLLWRYAVSWVSGYFIFQMFTPIAFHYYGAVEAGKVGLTIAICTAVFGIANIWMTIIMPKMNILIAHKDYKKLDHIFRRHLFLAVLSYIFAIAILFGIINFLNDIFPLFDRVVSNFSLLIITISWLVQIIINGYAMYMRAHKEEPLFVLSFISGLYVVCATLLVVHFFSFEYFFIGFLSSYIFILPWVMKIFHRYKGGYS